MKVFILSIVCIIVTLACKSGENPEQNPAPEKVETAPSDVDSPKAADENKVVVARVNGNPIYKQDLGAKPVDVAVSDEILYDEALRRGLDDKYANDIEQYKKNYLLSRLKREIILSDPNNVKVTKEEVEDYYNKNRDKYTSLMAKLIAVQNKDIAEEIRGKVLAGADFNDLAKEYTDADNKAVVQETKVNPKHKEYFESTEVGSISNVITQNGHYMIIKITGEETVPESKVAKHIRQDILEIKKSLAIRDFTEEVKKNNNIEVEIVGEKKN